MKIKSLFKKLNVNLGQNTGFDINVFSPIDGSLISSLSFENIETINAKITNAHKAFEIWRDIPAPKRGETLRAFAEHLRSIKDDLAQLITIECGKILSESRGEVQEMIDICDYAVGLSRNLAGLTLPSERENHNMQENWYPLGTVLVISAFNFPAAVWAWNFALAICCGNSVIWKPSEKTPLTALACQQAFFDAVQKNNLLIPKNLSQIVLCNSIDAQYIANDPSIKLLSATGSTKMGKTLAPLVAQRFGRSLLELGGNNAVIVTQSANLDIALPSIVFGAAGTSGQRCTTTRRIIAHESIYEKLYQMLINAYQLLYKKIGDPLKNDNLIGPLIDANSYNNMVKTLQDAAEENCEIYGGRRVLIDKYPDSYYVEPAIISMKIQSKIVHKETFAPIVYLLKYSKIEEAIELNNAVPQGLSAAIFSNDVREIELFKKYCDCGICNVNIGTSGAEIGGAFGGEKETGGGRESGSDSWKNYMRRQTSTLYYGINPPPLAQGVEFG